MGSLLCFVEVKLMTNSSVRFLSLLNPTVVTHSGFYLRELKWYKGFFLKWMFQGFFCMKGFVVPEVLGNDMFHSKVLRPYERWKFTLDWSLFPWLLHHKTQLQFVSELPLFSDLLFSLDRSKVCLLIGWPFVRDQVAKANTSSTERWALLAYYGGGFRILSARSELRNVFLKESCFRVGQLIRIQICK